MKIFKATVYVFDFEGDGETSIKQRLGNIKNMSSEVGVIESLDVEWSDEHPMNQISTNKDFWWLDHVGH